MSSKSFSKLLPAFLLFLLGELVDGVVTVDNMTKDNKSLQLDLICNIYNMTS